MTTDFSAIRASLESVSREARALSSAIESNRRLREELAAAPLCKSDVAAEMLAQVDRWAASAPSLFDRQFQLIAQRPGKSWNNHPAPVLPDEGGSLSHALMGILAEQLKTGIETAILGRQEDPAAGDPWSERAVLLEQLDAAIAADEASLETLRAQVLASGLQWPGGVLYT